MNRIRDTYEKNPQTMAVLSLLEIEHQIVFRENKKIYVKQLPIKNIKVAC